MQGAHTKGIEMDYYVIAAKLYLINLALLFTHEIDSAFWHEWDLFNLPGGIDLFLIVNLVLIIVFLTGFEKVAAWKNGAWTYSLILALTGIGAFVIHMSFIVNGNPKFTTFISLSILILTFFISLGQLIFLIPIRKNRH